MGDIPDLNERQARELHGLDAETAAEVMASAVDEDGVVTSESIREAREQIAPKPAKVTHRTTESETVEYTSPARVHPLQDSAPGVEQLSEPGALDQWLDDDDNLRRARFNKLFYADIARATRITANTAEELAELGDDDALSEYESLINNLERHRQRAKALRGSHQKL